MELKEKSFLSPFAGALEGESETGQSKSDSLLGTEMLIVTISYDKVKHFI